MNQDKLEQLKARLGRVADLAAASWSNAVQVSGNGAVQTLTDTSATAPRRFYRVRVQ